MGPKINVSSGAFLSAAVVLLIVPARWWMGAILGATVHELSHVLAVWALGGQVARFWIGAFGAKIEAAPMERGKEVLASLTGPLGSLLTAWLTARFYPEAALCAFVQGLFNLIPIYPLDGGRILRCLASDAVCRAVEVFSLIVLWGIGFWLSIGYDLGLLPLIPACFAVMQLIPGKIPCKEPKLAVQ